MSIYQGLARIYDTLMEGVDYEGWAKYIQTLVQNYDQEPTSALDIACGTGSTSVPLSKLGWRVTGIDISGAMLQQARRKAGEAKEDIIFLQQDVCNLEFSREFDLITCFQDGLNYLLSSEELGQAFLSVYRHLCPGGLFIFDLNLVEKYALFALGETSFIDEEEFSLIYETSYIKDSEVWEIKVTGFVREEQFYSKFKETHREKHHRLEDVKKMLAQIGFSRVDTYDAFSLDSPRSESRRIFIVAQKDEGRD